MPQEKIIIKFIPEGHPQLIAAIKKLNVETKKLTGSTKGTEKTFSTLNTKMLQVHTTLKAQGKGWQALGISVKTGTAALMGNKNAVSMVNARLKVLGITQAQINKGALLGVRNNRLLANSFATLRSQLLLVSFGAMLVERAFVSLVKAHGRQEAANEKLAVGLTNVQGTTEGVTRRLIDYSSALQKVTAFGDEMITTGMVQFTTFGLNEQAIKALTPQVLNVARAIQTTSGSMPDLNSLFIAFGKATTTGIGTLTRYGVVLTEVERAQLESMDANESAVEIAKILDRQYGGLASAYAKTTAGMLEAAAAARGDAAEAFGEVLAPAVLKASKMFKVMFEAMSPEKIRQYGAGLLIGAGATTALAVATGRLNVQLALSRAALIRTGWGALVVGLGTAAFAILDYFGILEDTTNAQEDYEKRLKALTGEKHIFTAQVYAAIDAINAEKDAFSILIEEDKKDMDAKEKMLSLYQRLHHMKDGMSKADIDLLDIQRQMNHSQKLRNAGLISESQHLATIYALDIKMFKLSEARRKIDWTTRTKEQIEASRELMDTEIEKTEIEKAMADEMERLIRLDTEKYELTRLRIESEKRLKDVLKVSLDAPDPAGAIAPLTEALDVQFGLITEDAANRLNLERQVQNETIELFKSGQMTEIEAREHYNERMKELIAALAEEEKKAADEKAISFSEGLSMSISAIGAMTSAQSEQLNAEMRNMKAGDNYKNASREKQKQLEDNMLKSQARERTKIAEKEKLAKIASATMNTYEAVSKAWAQTGIFGAISGAVALMAGLAQVSAIMSTPIPKFAAGGMIGGRRHSQGGTMIEAEEGEFIINRDAVNKIGVENLERINNLVDVMSNMPTYQMAGNLITRAVIQEGRKEGKFQEGGLVGSSPVNISNMLSSPDIPATTPTQITVNVSGNVLSQDFVEGELAENIKEAIRRGTDFGIS